MRLAALAPLSRSFRIEVKVVETRATEARSLRDRIERVRERISQATQRSGRASGEVTLVAVSKTVGAEIIAEAARLGVTHVGENRVGEAEAKIPTVTALVAPSGQPSPVWHLIGHLQTNKARRATELFAMIESVDSVRLAEILDRLGRERGRPIPVLLEANIGGEATKFGFAPESLRSAFGRLAALPGLRLRGLMTVAPPVATPEAARPYFRELRLLRDQLAQDFPESSLPELSMGMTGDFEVAIEEGSTLVRIGRAIFGER